MQQDEKFDLILAELGSLRQDVHNEIHGLRGEMKEMQTGLRGEMQEMQKGLRGEMKEMQEMQTGLQNEMQEMKEELKDVKMRVKSLELHQENVTDRNIRILIENFLPAAERFNKAADQIETMQADFDVMKHVIAEHSKKLNQIA